MSTDSLTARTPSTPSRGADLKLSFFCPQCGQPGWVYWAQLPKGMRCPRCHTGFWIDTAGHLCSEREVSRYTVVCPRCRQAHRVAENLLRLGVCCESCQHRFVPEAVARNRSTVSPADDRPGKRGPQPWRRNRPLAHHWTWPWKTLVVVGVVCMGLAVAWGFYTAGRPPTLETTVNNFVRDWLQGNAASLHCYLDAGQGQEKDLLRWWMVFQGSRESLVTGGSNGVRFVATVVSSDGEQARVQINFTVAEKPTLVLLQCWRQQAGRWCFDPMATLQFLSQEE